MEAFLDNYDKIDCENSSKPTLINTDQYIKEGNVSYTDSNWELTDGSGKQIPWLNNIHFTFWSYAPKTHPGTFSYGTAGSRGTMNITDYVCPAEAGNQKDLLIAYNNRWYNDSNNSETVEHKFRHALASIHFDVSGINNCTLTGVTIKGAYCQGSCIITGTDLSDDDVTKAFSWTVDKTKTSDFEMTSDFGTDNFFIIPQTLPEGTKIGINISINGTPSYVEKSLSTTWLPGKSYKYILNFDPATYAFTINSEDAYKVFSNTSEDSEEVTIPVTSRKTMDSGTTDADWNILSYQIGTNEPVAVNNTSFTDKGGLTVAKDGNNIKIKALARPEYNQGYHNFWVGDNGNWSPADWSSSKASSSNPLDLSKWDFKTETATGTMTTANCYIVRHAGTYKIPLVYGNGVVNGLENTDSFAPTMAEGGDPNSFVSPLHNHLGNGITSAFIENNTGCTASATPVVVWKDRADIIKDLQITGDSTPGSHNADNVRYLQFSIAQEDIRQNNEVIAIKDSGGKIIWSWHIWITNDPALLSAPIPVLNHSSDVYNFFPIYCLGWLSPTDYQGREQVKIVLSQKTSKKDIEIVVDQTEVKGKSNGTFYQFGRKDPSPTLDAISGFSINNTALASLADAICNPGTLYVFGHNGNWCSSIYKNLWTGKFCAYYSTGANKAMMIKTIYDPSPVGYKIPDAGAYTGFTTTGNNATTFSQFNVAESSDSEFETSKGWTFYTSTAKSSTILFPAVGYRSFNNGLICDVAAYGSYWSSSLNSDDRGYNLDFGKKYIKPCLDNSLTYSFSIRPVKE